MDCEVVESLDIDGKGEEAGMGSCSLHIGIELGYLITSSYPIHLLRQTHFISLTLKLRDHDSQISYAYNWLINLPDQSPLIIQSRVLW